MIVCVSKVVLGANLHDMEYKCQNYRVGGMGFVLVISLRQVRQIIIRLSDLSQKMTGE